MNASILLPLAATVLAIAPSASAAAENRAAFNEFRVSEPYIISSPDGGRTQLRDINIHGEVIGLHGAVVPQQPGAPPYVTFLGWQLEPAGSRSFVWSRDKGFRDLGEMTVAAINDCGDIAGTLTTSVPYRAFRKVGNHIQDLGTLEPNNPNSWSIAMGINERGDVVGVASVSQDPAVGADIFAGFRWTEAEGMVPVHDPALFGAAFDINNRRQISGFRQGSTMSALSGSTLWDRDGTVLGNVSLGGRYGSAVAVNSFTQAVGSSATDHYQGPERSGYFWSPNTGIVELWPGDTGFYMDFGSYPYDIDDRGRIAGVVNLATTAGADPVRRAAIWTSLSEYHLLLDQSSDAVGLNNRGDVIGHLFNFDDFTQQGVLWRVHTPVDRTIVDATFATLAGLGICHRRKHGH